MKNASKKIKLAFDEYGVWDETVGKRYSSQPYRSIPNFSDIGTPENGLEQYYNFTDALAMASWLNVFIRQADIVDIACIAQSVNVISPLITSPTGLFRQTIFHPLQLFSKYMRSGTSIQTSVQSPTFSGETLPEWISSIKGHPKDLDVSAVLATTPKRSLRISVINRNEKRAYQDVPIRIAFEDDLVGRDVEVHELWHEDIKAQNGWGHEDEVSVKTRRARWEGKWTFMEHSFTLFVLDL